MNCPQCKSEMIAVGGVPTVWQCSKCSAQQKTTVKYIGDTQASLRRI